MEGAAMSVETPRDAPSGSYQGSAGYVESHGDGWVTFAGVMLMLMGVINFIGGIAAIDNANFYTHSAHYQFGSLNTWGWIILITGGVQVLAALGIWARNQFARWLGVGFASLNAMAQLFMLPSFPLWSLAIFSIDILIIYGLVAYGSRDMA
jgi:hypothetical protein